MMIHDIMDLSTVLATHTRFATSNQTECLVGDRVRRFDRQHRHGGAVQSKVTLVGSLLLNDLWKPLI